jgi:hypothetical protein
MKRTLALGIVVAIFASLPSAFAATPKAPKAGATCSKAGATFTYAGKKFTCIKSGKKLVWNKGLRLSIIPSSKPTPADLIFYQIHRISTAEELLEIAITPSGVLRSKSILTTGPKFGLTILDMRNNRLLLEVDAGKGQLYILEPGKQNMPLGIERSGGIPTDSRSLNNMRLGIDGKSIFAFDFDVDFYKIDISGPYPIWTRLFMGLQFASILESLGGDQKYDWVQDFEIVGTNEILVMTKNSFAGTIRIWSVSTSLTSPDSPKVFKIAEYQSSNVLGDDSAELSISPDGSKVAILHTVSALTPKSKLLIYSVSSKVFTEFPKSQLFEGNNYFLSWSGENKLLMTINQNWTNDKNGGRITCLLDLNTKNICKNISGVSGYSLVGRR